MAAPRAVVLLSGGLDSATVLALAREQGFRLAALTVSYGQRQQAELRAAERVAHAAGVEEHRVVAVDLRSLGGSALTADLPVPKGEGPVPADGVPVTYVPARNFLFLALAAGWAEVLGSRDVFLGINALDFSGYPDCRPDFLEAAETAVRLGTKAGRQGDPIRLHAPLLRMTKAEIIRKGTELGVDYSLTHSCYDPDPRGRACGRCDSCRLRRQGFLAAGISDPTPYQDGSGC